ncbi:glycoside hydrolase family 25 protein [Coniochaeta ligniaria NRRL 30616]|uniref:N,O-diacetylmuramidase n=1 Tax=Coniochaeta ligniaria NRRL 30616 TaxID=1408157 RepID=A0A1J7IGZ1_9PEZI|nr:glycoside hydrolase family 25 protein [Coniochaeta ligniaria NRRL 30616]
MKSTIAAILALAATAQATVQGFDISHYQSSVNYAGAYAAGARFVIIKATEGTTYTDPSFSTHYTGATNAGLIRGGYHFAHPGETTGAAQADYFITHGGGWSGDGITLPGMLDLESEGGATCWGLSTSAMVAWIKAFSDRYHSQTGRYPMLYTNPSWWTSCTGNSNAFVSTNPLVLARYASAPGTIPGGWPYQTIWQNSDSYAYGGDSDIFNGSLDNLRKLATG